MNDFKAKIESSIESCKCFSPDEILQQDEEHAQCSHKLVKSEARAEYEHTHRDEILLNERFRQFVCNFKLAYEAGSNEWKGGMFLAH